MNTAAVAAEVVDVQGDKRWMSIHERYVAESKDREPEVLFIGDSLILQLVHTELWTKLFEPLHCLNFGIGGDQTQHVLWRIQNGELESLSPKVIVLLVGTNNYDHTAEEVAEGILVITKTIATKQPQANIIVMGLPPRGQNPNPLREKISSINAALKEQVPTIENALFFNIEPALFINGQDETISHRDMYDYLHLTPKGYQKLCEPLLEEIQNLLKQFLTADTASTEAD